MNAPIYYEAATQELAEPHIPPDLRQSMDFSHKCATCGEPLVVMKDSFGKLTQAAAVAQREVILRCARCIKDESPETDRLEVIDPEFTARMNEYHASKN